MPNKYPWHYSRRDIKCCGCGKKGVHFINCPDCQREAAKVKKMSSKTFREWAELSLKNYRQRKEREAASLDLQERK